MGRGVTQNRPVPELVEGRPSGDETQSPGQVDNTFKK